MPAIALMILQAIQAGIAVTPEIMSAVGEIVNMIRNPGVPTPAQWATLDAAVMAIMKQQEAIVINKGEMPTTVSAVMAPA